MQTTTQILRAPLDDMTPEALRDHFLRDDRVFYPALPPFTAAHHARADQLLAHCFDLIGEPYTLPPGFSWALNPSRDKEWQIAQHKFPFALDLALAFRQSGDPAYLRCLVELLRSWLAEMGTGFITASDAQVEAKRIENWLLTLAALAGTKAAPHIPSELLCALIERIADEASYVLQNLKPTRNHRTFQLYSVFLVGTLLPELAESAQLTQVSADLLRANLMDDFLPDGVHVELSSHYHQLVLEVGLSFAQLSLLNQRPLDPALLERLQRAAHFTAWIQHPDGSIPLLNDSDDGDQRPLLTLAAELFDDPELTLAATLGAAGEPPRVASRHFEDSGYVVLSDGWGLTAGEFRMRQHVIYDCAQLGEGSHSHYDLFNFCYFAGGRPLIIDPGRYTYSAEPDQDGVDWRQHFKSTAAHNTVTIDGCDQTRYHSKWLRDRAGAASHPAEGAKHGPAIDLVNKHVFLGRQSDVIWGRARSHEYTPIHERVLLFFQRQYLVLIDRIAIEDSEQHTCTARLHLSPSMRGRIALTHDGDQLRAHAPGLQILAWCPPQVEAQIEQGWASQQYGVKAPAPVLALMQRSQRSIAFVTLIAAGPTILEDLRVSASDDVGSLQVQVVGRSRAAEFTDQLIFNHEGHNFQRDDSDIQFAGRFLALRRDANQRLRAVCAHGAELLCLPDGTEHRSSTGASIEWLR
jgi:Heparinase II/III N-terminus/Heparinase II/III-like protein